MNGICLQHGREPTHLLAGRRSVARPAVAWYRAPRFLSGAHLASVSNVDPSVLARVVLFSEFHPEELQELSRNVRRRSYQRGDDVFLQGDPGSTLYIVESGLIRINVVEADRGKQLVLALVGPGEFFGELALLDGEPRSADAVAHADSLLLLLEREDFLRFVMERPSVTRKLLSVLSRRLRQDTQVLQDAAFLDVPARLARALLQLAEAPGVEQRGPGRVLLPKMTQRELAGVVGATRESVNKWLGFYERQGLIARAAGRFLVLDTEGLRRRVY